MRFFIDPEKFFVRGEENNRFSIMVRATNQQLLFHRSAWALFQLAGSWTDLDSFVDGLHITSVPRERVMRDYTDTLIDLCVVGVARLEDIPVSSHSGCAKAQKRDALKLSAFMMDHFDRGFSCASVTIRNYYAKNNLQTRIKGQEDSVFYYEQDGQVLAATVFTLSGRNFGGSVVMLESFIVHESLSEAEAEKILGELLAFARREALNLPKLRYEHIHPRQDWVVSVLLKNGFVRTAVFPRELTTGQTLTLYDCFL